MNARGPCSSCGAALATDQRYCVECGQRVGPPLALPYATSAPLAVTQPQAKGFLASLPVPIQTVSAFAAVALGFGVVVGTAISPTLTGVVAAPGPSFVAEAPPTTETPPAPATGGGGSGGGGVPVASTGTSTTSSSRTSGSSTVGGAGGKKKKQKQPKEQPQTFTGTVVRANPIAGSYALSVGGNLISIHADTLPDVGSLVTSPVRRLRNGTYAEQGARSASGIADTATVIGTVTYCADLEQPTAACDSQKPGEHYVYTVSSLGSSILVSGNGSAPKVGSQVEAGVHIGAQFTPVAPTAADWATDTTCAPAYNEQVGVPQPPVTAPELTETSLKVNGQSTATLVEAVVQTTCPGNRVVLSADDIRLSGRDLTKRAPDPIGLALPGAVDPAKLAPGQAVQLDVMIGGDGTLTAQGITSDQGAAGADDAAQGQGTLTGT
jgi:hypothetical protein